MATMAGKQSNLVDALNSLIELDFDAIQAYDAAIDRVSSIDDKNQLGGFRADHERHTRDLAECVVKLGGTAKTKGDAKAMLTKGKVVIAGMANEKAVFMAMKTNEDDTNAAYENATTRHDCPADVMVILQKNLTDERRHRAWIEERIRSWGRAQPQP